MKSTLVFNIFIALNLALIMVFMSPQVIRGQITDPPTIQKVKELLKQDRELDGKGSFEQQLKIRQELLAIARKNNYSSLEALFLLQISHTYLAASNPQLSLQHSLLALSIYQQMKDQVGAVRALIIIGKTYLGMSQYTEALKVYQEALTLVKKLDDKDYQASSLNTEKLDIADYQASALHGIAVVYGRMGKPQQAIDTLKQVLLAYKGNAKNQISKGTTLSTLGKILSDVGRYEEAIESLDSAIKVLRLAGGQEEEAAALTNLGTVYFNMNRRSAAIDYFTQALLIFKKIKNKFGEATIYNNIARTYNSLKSPQEALTYYNLALSTYENGSDIKFKATVINNIGGIFLDQKKYDEAIQQYLKSLNLMVKIGDSQGEMKILSSLAETHRHINQLEEAYNYYQRALALSQKTGYFVDEAAIHSGIGSTYKIQERLPEAIQSWEKSLTQQMTLRRDLKQENRTAFTEETGYQGTATALIDVLIDTQQSKRAYEWSNLFTTAELADYTRLLNAKVTNPKAQEAIDRWNQSNSELQAIRQQLQEKYAPATAQRMREKEAQVNQQAEAITAQHSEIAELFETKLSDIAKLQANLPIGTTALHPVRLDGFSNVQKNLALFVITRNSLAVKKVPVKKEELDQLISETYGRITNRRSSTYRQNLATLYNLLIKPIESELVSQKTEQLSIIATGQLRYIPFESLYDQATSQYLIEKYPINYLTRLSVNSFDKSPTAKLGANFKILALGNPVTKEPLNLPGALAEVNAIVPLFPGSQSLTGHNATLNEFKIQSPQFQILHLATHGCFQSGGCPRLGLKENTILFADRQFNIADAALLGLKNTELVTLTACQSALNSLKLDDRGQLALDGGTELSGLAYLLERAGAKAVIPTLWSVEDESTQAISVSFYSNLKQGMNKSEALRQAKLRHIDKHPFFWAPLILIGDPR
jgi:CHAT domain-containing protein/Tfp pilus assembly protein PilF